MARFLEFLDTVGATAFGCLLYGLGRETEAELWWGVAAGAEDTLAVHYAATGRTARAQAVRDNLEEVEPERLPPPRPGRRTRRPPGRESPARLRRRGAGIGTPGRRRAQSAPARPRRRTSPVRRR
ncbi:MULTISPECIES: hypothetical protein [unclassified Kitasatospora]|uniref:hypothetical protein n=1 Tax=unclassified Kitasatospora TaxID=2633591 RepID=UPI0024767C80|nr:hypothetical protein [Kitasatospora sp. GAS204B]